MNPSIPVSDIVVVNPGVIGAGGSPLQLNGVILTHDTSIPIGTVQPFPSADAVSNWFGPLSLEAGLAAIYFAGRDNATALPTQLFFVQYPSANVAAYARGASIAGMTLANIQALSGTLIVTIDGVLHTSSSVNLSGATSFSNAAALMQAGFTGLGGTVTYNSQLQAFVITSSTTGASSTISAVTGTLAAGVKLSAASGSVLSQGAIAGVPATAMNVVKSVTQNWACFMTTFEPVLADKEAFAVWTSASSGRYGYAVWDTDANAILANNTASFGAQALALQYDGVCPVYNTPQLAAFVLGLTASIDFKRENGRITYAFKTLAGMAATVTDQTVAANLRANGYNYYGAYATANQGFNFFYPGSTPGKYDFFDEYVNQIWMNNALQLAIITGLIAMPSIPYNAQGYSALDAFCQDPINAAVNFGAIRPNVPLSSSQVTQVNVAAGVPIANILSTRGWYLQILPASVQTRGLRQSPPMTLWYMDGGSIQQVTLASILVQ